jgi:hypothetical protein
VLELQNYLLVCVKFVPTTKCIMILRIMVFRKPKLFNVLVGSIGKKEEVCGYVLSGAIHPRVKRLVVWQSWIE